MRKILIIIFLIQPLALPQSSSFDFHSQKNIKLFADHLFCTGDYIRAIDQYEHLQNQFINDTIDFKIMLGYSKLELYENSNEVFNKLSYRTNLYSEGYLLSMKNKLIIEKKELNNPSLSSFNSQQLKSFTRLRAISMLYADQPFVTKENYISIFEVDEQSTISFLYEYKFNPPYKSPALAGILSTIIPGSGKMYVGEWGDGITNLVLTGLFAFLAYDNFKADHTTRAWIFTGIGAFFYAGNIYGSIASTQIFNAKIDFDFNNGIKLFLEKENYFLPEYDFCN